MRPDGDRGGTTGGGPSAPPPDAAPRSSGVVLPLLIGCGALLLVGTVCATLATFFLTARVADPPSSGSQPGGEITGRVLPLEAARDVGTARLWHGQGWSSRSLETVSLDADGRFRFDAPPVEGYYAVSAGGGTWSLARGVVTMVDEQGATQAVEPLELVLRPACMLEVRVRRAGDESSPQGDVRFRLERADGALFGLLPRTYSGTVGLIDGVAILESMPEGEGELTVIMDDGATRSAPIELRLDDPHRVIELTL